MFQALGAAVNALPGRDISTELAIQVGRTNVRKFKLIPSSEFTELGLWYRCRAFIPA
jgi:hypothetical protein